MGPRVRLRARMSLNPTGLSPHTGGSQKGHQAGPACIQVPLFLPTNPRPQADLWARGRLCPHRCPSGGLSSRAIVLSAYTPGKLWSFDVTYQDLAPGGLLQWPLSQESSCLCPAPLSRLLVDTVPAITLATVYAATRHASHSLL